MNIPDNILQAAIDAAFRTLPENSCGTLVYSKRYPEGWVEEAPARLDLFKRALASIAPHIATAGVGVYTDEEIDAAWKAAVESKDSFVDKVRALIAALPHRESPPLAEAIARAEKVEAERDELKKWKESAMAVEREWDAQAIAKALGATLGQSCRQVIAKRVPELLAELATLRASQIGVLRTMAEAGPAENKVWIDPACGCTRSPYDPREMPCPVCKPAEEVPMGPEDCPPDPGRHLLPGRLFSQGHGHRPSRGLKTRSHPAHHRSVIPAKN